MLQTRTLIVFGALSALALIGRPARAALVIEALNSSAAPGGTGSFDVDLLDNGGTFNVSAFSFGLSVAGASGLTFTGVNTATTSAPYLFGTLQFPPLTFSSFPTASFTASDSDATPPFFTTLTPGSTFGLGHVTYAVAPGTALGPIPISFVSNNTNLSDVNANTVPASTQPGTVTVAVAPAVPEPGTLPLLGLGLLGLGGLRARRPATAAG